MTMRVSEVFQQLDMYCVALITGTLLCYAALIFGTGYLLWRAKGQP